MALTIKERFENKRNVYANAMNLIKAIKDKDFVKDDKNIQSILKVVWDNGKIVNNSLSMAKAAKSDDAMMQKWGELKRNMIPIPIKKDKLSLMQKFFENMPEDIVRSKDYKCLYEACVDSFGSSKQQEAYSWKDK